LQTNRGYVAHQLKKQIKERKSKVVKKMESANFMQFFFSEVVFRRTNLRIFKQKQLDKTAIKQRMKTDF
jgi:hypothetical protein